LTIMSEKSGKPRHATYDSPLRHHQEEGTIIKDWGGRLPVALIYPNSYFLGMSNLGIHAIYRLLNNYPDIVCERFFLEKGDHNTPVSLESGRPLTDFAVLAFSVSYELDYFNVVKILKLSGIPLFSSERNERHPLIIVGGPCVTANPMPLSPFFDCLCIGEAEPILSVVLPVLSQGIGGSRSELLKSLASLPGIFVPSQKQIKVVRQHAPNLDSFTTTSALFTPDTELGDMYLIEVERGCLRSCRFCLVSTAFSPARFRSLNLLLTQAHEGLRYRKRIGLVGPAVTDHPQINDLLVGLNHMGAEIAVSSLRISSLSVKILDELAHGGAFTITIAPEAGSFRLRRILNKNISNNEIMAVADAVGRHGFHQLKLYFIIGLPTETDDDTMDIVKLVTAIKDKLDNQKSITRLVVNISPFVPKAGTPFQWLPMAQPDILDRRIAILKKSFPRQGIKLNIESPAWSRVQGILSRGDARIAPALVDTPDFSISSWRYAVDKHNLDIDFYVNQRWDTSKELPWAIIDSGISPEKLCANLEMALEK
jgi:radical SAM superfamily enzyme YgiQ (UPF0313 family)